MAHLQAHRRPQELRRGRRHQGRRPRDRDGRVHGLRRALGLRQVHAAAADLRARGHHLGRHAVRQRAGQRPGAVEARHRHGVPELRALPAHEGLRQHGLRHEAAEGRRRRHQGAGDEGGEAPADRPPARPAAEAALGRPAAARGDRPGDRARPAGVPVRRAAVEPRRGAARGDPARDRQAAPLDGQRDDGLRHPRPGRGDDAGRPHLRAARRPRHAGGLARPSSTRSRTRSSSPASSARRR